MNRQFDDAEELTSSVGPEMDFKGSHEFHHFPHALTSKLGHDYCVIFHGIG